MGGEDQSLGAVGGVERRRQPGVKLQRTQGLVPSEQPVGQHAPEAGLRGERAEARPPAVVGQVVDVDAVQAAEGVYAWSLVERSLSPIELGDQRGTRRQVAVVENAFAQTRLVAPLDRGHRQGHDALQRLGYGAGKQEKPRGIGKVARQPSGAVLDGTGLLSGVHRRLLLLIAGSRA